jgi:hypothetical protein
MNAFHSNSDKVTWRNDKITYRPIDTYGVAKSDWYNKGFFPM